MSDIAVRVAGLTIEAGGERLIGPVDLELRAGESLLLVGRSGSGKTTLLRAIAGLVEPHRGTIELFGVPASAAGRVTLAPEHRGVGMLFQGGALWPHMSVERTLRFTLGCAGVKAAEVAGRVDELLARVELQGLEKRMPATLSGGERQRLALARAMAGKPRLLLFDEPLGPLDAELRAALIERLARLHDELGWTTIHVTHDPGEASSSASHILRMEDGRLVEEPTE